MSDDRHSTKHNVNVNNYTFSSDDDRFHYYVIEDDYKITITVEATEIESSKKTEKSDKKEKGTKEKED